MCEVSWTLATVQGAVLGSGSRQVTMVAKCVPGPGANEQSAILCSFDVMVHSDLSDLGAIEREAYSMIRDALPNLVAALPDGDAHVKEA